MSSLYDLILQRKGELQTETVQVVDAVQAWRLGFERCPHCIRGVVRRDAGRNGSAAEPSNSAKRRVSELLGMELRLESSALRDGIDATAQFFKTQRVVVCCGDRLTLTCLCLAEPIRRAVVGAAATTEDEGFELVLRHKPSLLICTSDLETGCGMNLLRRVKA